MAHTPDDPDDEAEDWPDLRLSILFAIVLSVIAIILGT